MFNRRIIRNTAAALSIVASTSGRVSAQVTWQSLSQTNGMWQSLTIGPADTTSPWGIWEWSGFIHSGDVIYLKMDSNDRPEVAGTVYTSGDNWLPYWAKPSGPGTWNVYDTAAPPSATGHPSQPLRPSGAVVDSAGDSYAVSGGALAGCFGCGGFRRYKLWPLTLVSEAYVNVFNPVHAVVRANPSGGGVHWLGSTQPFHNGSNCASGILYYDDNELFPFGTLSHGKAASFDMAIGGDGVPILVAEFMDVCGVTNGSGLYFARGDVPHPSWIQIVPPDAIGPRGVQVVIDPSNVIHIFTASAQTTQPAGANGPLHRWWSVDSGSTWLGPEVVLSDIEYRDWYTVGVSPTGAIGVAYWMSCCSSPHELRFAERRFGSWHYYANVGTTGQTEPGVIKVAYDSQDRPNIAYFERPQAGLPPWVKVTTLLRPVRPSRQ
ncbi:MAG: hypothetical protein ACKVWV_15890 [Planctomycetota bacterium]